eukprot:COSAG02_NODE_31589_length_531_cov_0.664352_1_plen_51_part_00
MYRACDDLPTLQLYLEVVDSEKLENVHAVSNVHVGSYLKVFMGENSTNLI